MSTRFIVPDTKSVSDILSMIFGDGLSASDQDSSDLAGAHVATFIDDDDQLVAVCACDAPFVAYSGAALSMVPANAANDMIKEGDMSKAVSDNFYEVMNICSKLLMSDTSAHLRLDRVLPPSEGVEPIGTLNESGQVQSFEVDIPQYGGGSITFVVT